MLTTGLRLIGAYVVVQSISMIGFNAHHLAQWNSDSGELELAKNAAEAALFLTAAAIIVGVLPAAALACYADSVAQWLQRGPSSIDSSPRNETLYAVGLLLMSFYFVVSGASSLFSGIVQVAAGLSRGDPMPWFSYFLPNVIAGIVRVGAGWWLYLRSRAENPTKRAA